MTTTADNQYLEIQREQLRINDVLNLLLNIYRSCNNKYNKVLTADYIKEKSLPNQITQVIVDKNLVKTKGIGNGKLLMWVANRMPDENMATEVWEEACRIRNEYNVAKQRERRGETPNRVQIGSKSYVKLLTPSNTTKESVLKKQPTTVTEVKVYKMLKVVQIFLCTGQRVMDFSTLCEHKGISTRYEKALLKTCVRRTDHGFEWNVADDIDYDLVRQVIEVAKTISDVELDIPTPLIKIGKEEPKSEFENSTEKVESKNEVEEISINERRKYNIFIMLQTLRKVIATKRISSISEYCTNFNLTNNLGGVLVELNIIQKIKGSYVWIGSDPSKELVEQIINVILNVVVSIMIIKKRQKILPLLRR